MKLFDNSKIYFIDPKGKRFKYMGWGTVGSTAHWLGHKLGEHGNAKAPQTIAKLNELRTKGFVVFDGVHHIVEKAIPLEIRKEVRNDKIELQDVLKQLKL